MEAPIILASLRDTIQIYFYRGILYCTPCYQDKNDYMSLENRSITTMMILGTLNVNNHVFEAYVLHKQ